MRRWGLASLVAIAACGVVASPRAFAEPTAGTGGVAGTAGEVTAAGGPTDVSTAPVQDIGYGAMPGGIHVFGAETLPKGAVEVFMLSGGGKRSGLLGTDHRFGRAVGDLAVGYGVLDILSLALSLDGRYDRHYGLPPSGDDGYVGDPHVYARLAKAVGKNHFGGQLGIWVPGKNAPSVAGSAISFDITGLASFAAGPATLSIDAGFRLDNSASSIDTTSLGKLSLQDRVSLGISNYNEVYGGAHLMVPAGKAWVGIEASAEAFIGSPPTGQADLKEGSLILRGGAQVGFHLNDQWALLGFAELAKVPGVLLTQVMTASIPIIPYEPTFTAGLALSARFGGPTKSLGGGIVESDCHKHTPPDCKSVVVPITADITGSIVDDTGKPVVGAKVELTLKNSKVDAVASDDKGTYIWKNVPIGTSTDNKPTIEETGVEVNVSVDGKKPGKAALTTVTQGTNTLPPIKLESSLPPGQLTVLVRSLTNGKPVSGATIVVTPGDQKFESGADGQSTINLAPGTYKITVNMKGFAQQELDVVVEPNSVAIKNIDLRK
jgi:hypothetical protein